MTQDEAVSRHYKLQSGLRTVMETYQAEDVETEMKQILTHITKLLRQFKVGGFRVKGVGLSLCRIIYANVHNDQANTT